jgi:hypothetical protein
MVDTITQLVASSAGHNIADETIPYPPAVARTGRLSPPASSLRRSIDRPTEVAEQLRPRSRGVPTSF